MLRSCCESTFPSRIWAVLPFASPGQFYDGRAPLMGRVFIYPSLSEAFWPVVIRVCD